MCRLIEPYADGTNYFEAHQLAVRGIPMDLPPEQKAAFRQAIDAVTTPEEVMELYIRHIGIHSFRFFFKKKSREERAQLLLFRDRNAPPAHEARSSAHH